MRPKQPMVLHHSHVIDGPAAVPTVRWSLTDYATGQTLFEGRGSKEGEALRNFQANLRTGGWSEKEISKFLHDQAMDLCTCRVKKFLKHD